MRSSFSRIAAAASFFHVEVHMPARFLHSHSIVVAGIADQRQALAFAFDLMGGLVQGMAVRSSCGNAGHDVALINQERHFLSQL